MNTEIKIKATQMEPSQDDIVIEKEFNLEYRWIRDYGEDLEVERIKDIAVRVTKTSGEFEHYYPNENGEVEFCFWREYHSLESAKTIEILVLFNNDDEIEHIDITKDIIVR